MVIDMDEAQVRSAQQMREVLAGTQALKFRPGGDDQARYGWVAAVLRRVGYRHLGRADRGVARAYLQHLSGYSRAQVSRLIARWMDHQPLVKRHRPPEHAFARRYTPADVMLLAEVDRAFENLSGPATVRILQRQRDVFGDDRFERLGSLSASHLYNLRASGAYREHRLTVTKTRTTTAPGIGQRRTPQPQGTPGFIRIDSVHQGDLDGMKGMYLINAVDCVTQWQVVACVPAISDAYMAPALQHLLGQFPFAILGFHADNGSEYVNRNVAAMLARQHIDFTRSRPRRSNDNALVETKNGAVVRKLLGFDHIAQRHAGRFNTFCAEYLNPFLNFHRPCLFPTERPDPRKPGRIKRIYRADDVMTPLERLDSLPDVHQRMRPGVTLEHLRELARALTDLQAAQELQQARAALYRRVPARA